MKNVQLTKHAAAFKGLIKQIMDLTQTISAIATKQFLLERVDILADNRVTSASVLRIAMTFITTDGRSLKDYTLPELEMLIVLLEGIQDNPHRLIEANAESINLRRGINVKNPFLPEVEAAAIAAANYWIKLEGVDYIDNYILK